MKTYYRPDEVATRLDITVRTVYRWAKIGILPAFVEPKTGTIRIPVAEFERYLAARLLAARQVPIGD